MAGTASTSPGNLFLQLGGAQRVHALPALVVLADQAALAQGPEVVAERRRGDRQAEGAAGAVTLGLEQADDRPAGGVSERTGLTAAALAFTIAPAAAAETHPHPTPYGPQRRYEPDVPGR
ncbi:hypothetical protein [Amycolatopsis methanolica]|uniref:hypothetical protein n=1 Tax=Amycolatopsis methanolica TaxID=1814 RepID=UPI001B7FE25F